MPFDILNEDPNIKPYIDCHLRGPTHPLSYNLSSVHRIGMAKRTNVEQESVNSILLDDQPESEIDQFFVAAHVGLNQSKSALMVST